MKALLAFDTSSRGMSLSILRGLELLLSKNITESSRHAELLIPKIEECLVESQISYQDLDFVVTTIGPGSFTGIRIGLTCAKTMALATKVKIIGIRCDEAMAFSQLHKAKESAAQKILTLIKLPSGKFYCSIFEVENFFFAETKNMILDEEELKKIADNTIYWICGLDFINDYNDEIIEYIDATDLGRLALEKLRLNIQSDDLSPIYAASNF